ncbi:7605_t:CDS:10 [Funneliformis caledonium]|uniref:7605_t:CDS:1 n=1 Tax=Funneliformis caledonium TaxID=1117310 RepID=A0A9N8VTF2_9GLOM|nr:7605_t:CDS:10 [Funneliformis caledonium]
MAQCIKWIDDIVKLRHINLIPFEEFDAKEGDDRVNYWKKTGIKVSSKIVQNNLIVDDEMNKLFLHEYPWNIVFHQNRVKLSNFGMIKYLTSPTSVDASTLDEFSINNVPYVEPQLLLDKSYRKDARSDIYGLGVIMWEISSGRSPYQDDPIKRNLIFNILHNKRENVIPNTPIAYSEFYTRCWNNDPTKRPIIGILLKQLKNLLDIMNTGHKSSNRMSEQELLEMAKDAMTAELWLTKIDKKIEKPTPTQITKIVTTEHDKKSLKITTEGLNVSNVRKEIKHTNTTVITNEPELTMEQTTLKKSWKKKVKTRAKKLVRRLSGSEKLFRRSSGRSTHVLSEGADWTTVLSDKEKETPTTPRSETSLKGRGFFNIGRSYSDNSMKRISTITAEPDKFPYSEYCRMLFASNNWTINSAPCFAAYHVRQGDIDGLKWHVKVQEEEVNKVQQVTGPRNSYRRPLESLMIEAAQYCPGEKIIETFNVLRSLKATCDCTNSYTGGSPINYLGENKSLFSAETNSKHFKESLIYLMSNGCSINSTKNNGDTLLLTILFKWHKGLTPNLLRFCLENGANPNSRNEIGGNPLGYTLTQVRFNYHCGPFEKIYKIIKLLVSHGADVNKQITIPGKKLPNLLFVCVDMGINMREEWVKKLIKMAFDLTDDQKEKELIKSGEALNVLGYAAKLSQLETIKVLLDRIYSLSSPESIKEALNVTGSEEGEQRKFLKSWLKESGKEKRDKYWSANSTPILWSNIIPSQGIITTYMAFFTEKEQKVLEKSGITFDKVCERKSATYCYPSFLKSISMQELSQAIFLWCRNNCPQPISKQYNLLLRGILNIFAKHCVTLYQLDLDKRSLLDNLHHELWILLQEPNYQSFISNIKQLSLDVRKLVNVECLELLCQTCQRLKILKVDMTLDETYWSSDQKLAEIIKSQKELKTFYLRRGKITPTIISALEYHAKSLKMLHFRRVDFKKCKSLRSIFKESNQLEVLIVHGCKNLSENICKELMNTTSFPKLVEVDCEGLVTWNTIIKRHDYQNIKVI